MNKVVLIGRLTRDPELRYTSSNIPSARFSLAVDRPFTSQSGERETDFINIVAFQKQAENIKKYVGKGSLVAVDGRIQTRNYEDKDGKRVKEVVDGKKKTVYDSVEKTIKKDLPSRVHARREMMKVLYTVTDVPTDNSGKKRNTKTVDVANKLFDEIAPKYAGRNGGYTRIVKIGQRKGDAAMEVLLELV